MKYLSQSLITLILLTGCQASRMAQKNDTLRSISFIDRNGMAETVSNKERLKQYKNTNFSGPQSYQKILRIYDRDKSGNIKAKMTSYYENGQPKQYLEIVNSRAFGPYIEWHDNGQIKLQVCVIGGEPDLNSQAEGTWLFDGHAIVWNREGNKIADFCYEKGKLNGISNEFHDNGSIWKHTPYAENYPHGTEEVFLDNGELLLFVNYENGTRHGTSKRFWCPGVVASEEQFNHGKLEYGRYFDQQGHLVAQINGGEGFRATFSRSHISELHQFKNGIPEGEVKVFGTDRKLFRTYHVKNETKHGIEIEYYEQPHLRDQPKMSVTWYEGKIQGIARTWYENGVQESNREMSRNAKNGLSTAWYIDGSLMLIEEYEFDKLLRGDYYRKGDKLPVSQVRDGKGTATLYDPEGNFLQKVNYQSGLPAPQAS